jgi:hypothetical protein
MSGLFAGNRSNSRFRGRARNARPAAVISLLACLAACPAGDGPSGRDRSSTVGDATHTPADTPGSLPQPGSAGTDTPHAAAPGGHAPGRPAPAPAGWSAGPLDRPRAGAYPATLVAVRTGRHEGHERVVFEFAGGAVPGYHLAYVDAPVQCGSGDPVPVAGDAWLEVRFEPAYAHTDDGRPTVTDRSRRVGFPNLRQLELTCDFEAHVTWVLGLASPGHFRVTALAGPARLVVDVAD